MSSTASGVRKDASAPAPDSYAIKLASAEPGNAPPMMTMAAGLALTAGLLLALLFPDGASAQVARGEVEDSGGRTLTLASGDRRIEVRDGCVRIEGGGQSLETGGCSDGNRALRAEGASQARKDAKTDGIVASPEDTLKNLVERCSDRVSGEARTPDGAPEGPGTSVEGTTEAEGGATPGADLSAEQCRIVLRAASGRESSEAGGGTTASENDAADLGSVGDQYGGAGTGATGSEGDGGSPPEETPETMQAPTERTTGEPPQKSTNNPPIGAPRTTGEATRLETTSEPPLPEAEPSNDAGASRQQYREELPEAAPGSPAQYATLPDPTESVPTPDGRDLSDSPGGSESEPASGAGGDEDTSSHGSSSPTLPTEETPNGPVAVLPDTGGPPILVLAAVVTVAVVGAVLAIRLLREGR